MMTIINAKIKEIVFSTDYFLVERFLLGIVTFGITAHVSLYFFSRFISPFNDSPLVRIICILIFASYGFFLNNNLKTPLRKIYYELSLCFVLPFSFTYMALLNPLAPSWIAALVFIGFTYGLLSKMYILPIGTLIGEFFAFWVYAQVHPDSSPWLLSNISVLIISFFSSLVSNAVVLALGDAKRHMAKLNVEHGPVKDTDERSITPIETTHPKNISPYSQKNNDIHGQSPHTRSTCSDHDSSLPDSLSGLNIKAGLRRINGNKTLYLDILNEFHNGNKETAKRLRQALSTNNLVDAASLIHTVKGTSGGIGADDLYHTVKAMESELQKSKHPNETLITNFEKALSDVLDSTALLTTIYRNHVIQTESRKDPQPQVLPDSELSFMLSKLNTMLEKNSMSAETYLQSIVISLEFHSGSSVKRLVDHVNQLDYSQAKIELATLSKKMGVSLE